MIVPIDPDQQQAHQLTGERAIDDLALKLWQSLPRSLRRRRRLETWRRCLGIASLLHHGPQTPCPMTVAESSYRRGFCHGLLEATEALERGASPASLNRYLMGPVMNWRDKRHRGEIEAPPQCVVGSERETREGAA